MKRKSYDGKYKAKVALEVIKSQKTISQIASEFDVHPNQATQWKKKVMEEIPNIFSRKRKREQKASEAQLKHSCVFTQYKFLLIK